MESGCMAIVGVVKSSTVAVLILVVRVNNGMNESVNMNAKRGLYKC